jgi:hypothetical protein
MIVSPITVFLWIGEKAEEEIRFGALNLIEAFFQDKDLSLFHNIPSYMNLKPISQT